MKIIPFPQTGLCRRNNFFFSILGGLFFLSLFFSCDILRISPFEVVRWTPGTGYHGEAGDIMVCLSFSHDPDKPSAEYAFSLTEDNAVLNGSFIWDGWTLIFQPAVPLEINRDYVLTIREDARDLTGLSMDKKFEGHFSTRERESRPSVRSVDPPDGAMVTDLRQELRIEFSEPITVNSCVNAISLSPSATGSWYVESESQRAVFIPREPWIWGTTYRIHISPEFSGLRGLTLGKEFTACFVAGDDKIPPRLEAAYALDRSGNPVIKLIPEEAGPLKQENTRWESFYRLRLDFSEPVDTADLKNRLVAEPALTLTLETLPAYSGQVVFDFAQKPEYASPFLLRLNTGFQDAAGNQSSLPVVFRVRADGPSSRPPSFIGIRMPMAPGDPVDDEALSFSVEAPFLNLPVRPGENRYPYDVSTAAWIELYFDVAPGADIDLLSLMNLFRLDATNNALFFSSRSMEADNFSPSDKPPAWEAYYRIKVKGVLTNTVDSGVVIFQIASGLRDSRGNRNEKTFTIPLLK